MIESLRSDSSETPRMPSILFRGWAANRRCRQRLIPGRCANGFTGKMSWCGQSINVSTASEVAIFIFTYVQPVAHPSGPSLTRHRSLSSSPLAQPPSSPSAAPLSCPYTIGIHCRLAFPADFFGSGPPGCSPLAENVMNWWPRWNSEALSRLLIGYDVGLICRCLRRADCPRTEWTIERRIRSGLRLHQSV